MKESNFNRAMDLSDGIFAYYLCGVLTSLFESGSKCPDVEKEAAQYMKVYYPHILVKDDADESNSSNPLQWS
jgi:hypothetical protein